MKYFDGYDHVTKRWLGCVKANNPKQAKASLSTKSGIHINFILVTERK